MISGSLTRSHLTSLIRTYVIDWEWDFSLSSLTSDSGTKARQIFRRQVKFESVKTAFFVEHFKSDVHSIFWVYGSSIYFFWSVTISDISLELRDT